MIKGELEKDVKNGRVKILQVGKTMDGKKKHPNESHDQVGRFEGKLK